MAKEHGHTSRSWRRALEAIRNDDLGRLDKELAKHPKIVGECGDYRLTLLHEAAAKNRVAAISRLLDAGVPVDVRGNDDGTPLHWAASLDHLDAAKVLVDAGASTKVSDGLGEGGTPLVQALFYAAQPTAEFLAERSLTPGNLRVATALGRLDLLEQLVDAEGPTAAARAARTWYRPHNEFPDWTPSDSPQEVLDEAFCWACRSGKLDAAQWLVRHGANHDAFIWYGTAVHYANWKGQRHVIEWLVEDMDVDLEVQDTLYGALPWEWAHHCGFPELARYLAEKSRSFSPDAEAHLRGAAPD